MKTKLLIFGITGDLGKHRLLPAIEQIISAGGFDDLSIIGVSRRVVDINGLMQYCNGASLVPKLSIYTMDLDNQADYKQLLDYVALKDDEQLLVYLSVPPQTVASIVDYMGEAGINTPNVKILLEKPFGVDLASAQQIASRISNYYNEAQIYRIDHYLAKEMAQNIVTIRGKNALFSRIWNNEFIESIKIIASETIGVEGRVNFYEQTGALRDVVQGHLMQLMALTLMDIPLELNWDDLPALRLNSLQQLRRIDSTQVIRAQYDGYRDEVGNPDSAVETFVSLQVNSDQPNWVGVPITLVAGKALSKKTTEIQIHLKKTDDAQSNCIIFRIQPNEGIDIQLFIKKPDYSQTLETRHLSFTYPPDTKLPDAYEQVIVDAISSRKSLFTSSEEVLQSWNILQPIQDDWQKHNNDLKIYPKGVDINKI